VVAPGQTERKIAVMGSVLSFAPREAATVRKPLAAGATASIVIFPGIRYERQGEAPQATSAKRETQRGKPRPSH
jgi:hypothetical protein